MSGDQGNWISGYSGTETKPRNATRDKSIFEGQQRRTHNQRDCSLPRASTYSGGSLFQDRQIKGNTRPGHMDETERFSQTGFTVR